MPHSSVYKTSSLQHWRLVLSTGFAIFIMFFGSGNLVIPIKIGQMVASGYAAGILGLFLTGIVLPLLGLTVIRFYNGSYLTFFGQLPKPFPYLLPLVILSLMGPLAVIPRCVLVSYGSFQLIAPHTPLWLFSALMCFVTYILAFDKRRIVPILGNALTPLLLLSLGFIVYLGIKNAAPLTKGLEFKQAFTTGLFSGYQTMDLVASFFFASSVISHIQKKLATHTISHKKKTLIIMASLIFGAAFLGLVYMSLVYLGALYAPILTEHSTQQGLAVVAFQTLGRKAAPLVCLTVVLACLTTAVVLNNVCSEFYQQKLFKGRLTTSQTMLVVMTLAFLMSNLDFDGILAFLGPLLEILYPSMIALTFISLLHKGFDLPLYRKLFYCVFASATAYTLYMLF